MTTRRGGDSPLRDPRFDAAWRTASSEEPSPTLDAAILAAAHREVGAKPQGLSAQAMRAHRRWWPLAAAATIAVIAIGVVQRAGQDDLVAPPIGSTVVSDMPAQSPKSVAESKERPAEAPVPGARADAAASASGAPVGRRAQLDSLAPRSTSGVHAGGPTDAERLAAPKAMLQKTEPAASPSASVEEKSEAARVAPASRPEAFPAHDAEQPAAAPPQVSGQRTSAGPPIADRAAETPALQRSEGGATSGKLAAPPAAPPAPFPAAPSTRAAGLVPPAASFSDGAHFAVPSAARSPPAGGPAADGTAAETRMKDRAPLPIPDWIALIRRLRDEGNTFEAARELTAFRSAHADHEELLPPDLRDWHPTQK